MWTLDFVGGKDNFMNRTFVFLSAHWQPKALKLKKPAVTTGLFNAFWAFIFLYVPLLFRQLQ